VEFNPQAFDALLNNMGHQFAWRKSYACPCFNPGSGQAKDTCPQCPHLERRVHAEHRDGWVPSPERPQGHG
jgi:hypothetical protein